MSVLLACFAALCFGAAMITSRFGMRDTDARAGAATSVPTAAAFFWLVSLVALDTGGLDWRAVGVFALVGLFFPAAATLINFVSTYRLGPALTSSIGGTSPLFAIVAALLVLGEPIPHRAALAAIAVVGGVATMSWSRTALDARRADWAIALPVAGSAVRGLAQVYAKLGLAIWPSPLAAALVGYSASSIVLLLADRVRPGGRGPRPARRARALFVATGLLNGIGLFAMYTALQRAPVAVVSPIVAAYPLVTLVLSAALVREEKLTAWSVAGAFVTVAGVVYLVTG